MTLTINVREHRRGNKNNGHSEKKPGNVGYTRLNTKTNKTKQKNITMRKQTQITYIEQVYHDS